MILLQHRLDSFEQDSIVWTCGLSYVIGAQVQQTYMPVSYTHLMLLFLSEIAGYSTPLFMTFKQAKEEGLNILKGSG